MAHSQNKILLIVEGKRTEPKLFHQFFFKMEMTNVEIIPFETNIYVLYNEIKKLNSNSDYDTTSTTEALKMIFDVQGKAEESKKLEEKYPYIYLCFDFEYQDKLIDILNKEEYLNEMLDYFNDETENGLLFINYPMIESYRDFPKNLNIYNYKDLKIEISKVPNYKSIVHKRGLQLNITKYNKLLFDFIVLQNVLKIEYIINKKYELPKWDVLISYLTGKEILALQFVNINDNKMLYVLCLSVCIGLYFYGKSYYDELEFLYKIITNSQEK